MAKNICRRDDPPPVPALRTFPDDLVSGQKVFGDNTCVNVNAVREKFFFDFPPQVACIRFGKVVTWDELYRERRERQRQQLENKRAGDIDRKIPVAVWVFYNDPDKCPFYSGWYTYIQGRDRRRGADSWAVGFQSSWNYQRLMRMVMTTFPLGLLPLEENFCDWMKAFVKTYPWMDEQRQEGKAFAWATVYPNREIAKLEERNR